MTNENQVQNEEIGPVDLEEQKMNEENLVDEEAKDCLLYTSDAADE